MSRFEASPFWTEERLALLAELWPTHTAAVIAAELGTTRGAVIGKANRLGLPAKAIAGPRKTAARRGAASRRRLAPLALEILDLDRDHCRFIEGETGAGARFCGLPTLRGSSWCATHYRQVWTRPPKPTSKRGAA